MNRILLSFKNNFFLFFRGFDFLVFLNYLPAKIFFSGKNYSIRKCRMAGSITLSENVKAFDCFLSGNITVGRYTSLNGPLTTVLSSSEGRIIIGSFCSIARGVQIQEYNHKYLRTSSYYFGQNIFKKGRSEDIESKGDIIIEDDVWIGTNCIILSGVKIGRGSIIAAGSTVNKDVEPYSIVGGVPAKFIKKRFSIQTINELEASKWWLWSKEEILLQEEFFMKFRN